MEKIITTPEIILIEELKHRLEEANIHSDIMEENSTFINASGNIIQYSLFVNEADMEKSMQIKNELVKEREKDENMPWCESCGYENVIKETIEHRFSSFWYLIASPILVAIGLLFPLVEILKWVFIAGGILSCFQFFMGHNEDIYTCKKCGHKFHRN